MKDFKDAEDFACAMILHRMLHPPKPQKALKTGKKKADAERPKERRARTNPNWDLETVKRLYLIEGMSAQKIGDEYGVCESTVRGLLRRNGIRRAK